MTVATRLNVVALNCGESVRIRVGVAVIAAVATQLSLPLLMTAVAGAAEAAVIPVNLSVGASLTAEDQGGGTTVADPGAGTDSLGSGYRILLHFDVGFQAHDQTTAREVSMSITRPTPLPNYAPGAVITLYAYSDWAVGVASSSTLGSQLTQFNADELKGPQLASKTYTFSYLVPAGESIPSDYLLTSTAYMDVSSSHSVNDPGMSFPLTTDNAITDAASNVPNPPSPSVDPGTSGSGTTVEIDNSGVDDGPIDAIPSPAASPVDGAADTLVGAPPDRQQNNQSSLGCDSPCVPLNGSSSTASSPDCFLSCGQQPSPAGCKVSTDYPHNSGHAPGTINVTDSIYCSRNVSALNVTVKLWENRWWGWNELNSGSAKSTGKYKVTANAAYTCHVTAEYRGTSDGFSVEGANRYSGSSSSTSFYAHQC